MNFHCICKVFHCAEKNLSQCDYCSWEENMNKPYKGEIHNWCKSPISKYALEAYTRRNIKNLGYVICGDISGHPSFKDSSPMRGNFYTSLVLECKGNFIETLNSTYQLIGPAIK